MSKQEKLDKCSSLTSNMTNKNHNNNNNNNNNINNSTNISNSNNTSSSTGEQPKTKRQKIEKIKKNSNNKEATTSTKIINTLQPPDLIDTGGDTHGHGHVHRNHQHHQNHQNHQQHEHLPKQQICSSLNSSAHSLATTPTSSNTSPNSTPSSSRATSLTQLLNVQNALVHILPTNETNPRTSTISLGDKRRSINSSNSTELSADEVDRSCHSNRMPDLLPRNENLNNPPPKACHSRTVAPSITLSPSELIASQNMREFEDSLIKQCLCGVSERTLQKPFQSHYSFDAFGQKRIAALTEWPTSKLLQFLSNLQLLFDIYLKQNSKGFICVTIMDVCNAIIRNERNLIDEIIVLAGYNNSYVQFLAARVLASFLVIAKQDLDDSWLKKLVDNLFDNERLDDLLIKKIHFSLDIIKRIVEWKDIDLHPLEDEIVDQSSNAGITTNVHRRSSTTTLEQNHSHNNEENGLLDSLSYMHFPLQQPTLDSNYFAVHFRDQEQLQNEENSQHRRAANGAGGNDSNHSHLLQSSRPHHSHQHSAHSEHHDEDDEDLEEDSEEGDEDDLDHDHVEDHEELTDDEDLDDVNEIAILHNAARHSHSLAQLQQQYSNYNNYSGSYQHSTQNSTTSTANNHNPSNSRVLQNHQNPVSNGSGCNIVPLTDSESFDTTHLKCVTIKILEDGWPALVRKMSNLISNHLEAEDAENCILNFLQLWENIISVKANLSVVKTLPFYAQLDKFEKLLNQNLCCTVYKQMLCLFNEALCYGSTLALQDILPDETCQLAHQIVRHVKDYRILESLPRRQPENVVSLLGFKRKPVCFAPNSLQSQPLSTLQDHEHENILEMDKTILQKMVLLVLKSIAVSVKEIRSDSSDSSIDSTDYDAFQDMVLIERSIRDVLKKLENFIKNTLEFHPDCHFSKILIHLFDDQDDHLIEAMVCTLDVTSGISFRNNAFPELVAMLNPVYTFLEFLKMISNSSDLLLDLLVSNETCFLLYLLRFLKYIRMNWQMFVQSCHDFGMGTNVLDEAMSVLIRLRLRISRLVSRQLYPYEISPVLRLLESCESLYEGNELA